MESENEHTIRKVMRSMAVYMALLDLGMKDFEKIRQKIHDIYGCTIADCYYHPEYLKEVLEELYGNKSKEIVKSISEYYGKSVENELVDDFLGVLSEKESNKIKPKTSKE